MTAESNGTNGTSVPVVTVSQLHDRVARYRTALVALLTLIKRDDTGYRSWADQNLVAQIERLLAENPR